VAKRASSGRHAVQLEYRFDRLLIRKLEQDYQLLVPEIRRPVGSVPPNSVQEMTNEQAGSHLCASLLGPTEGEPHDWKPDVGALVEYAQTHGYAVPSE
jgi:RecB family endonuclease NucS